MTNLNKQILDMMQNSEGHLTAEEAFLLAKKKHIDISVASIYRILNKLADDGSLLRISLDGQADIFDKTIKEHGHLICENCGEIIDFETSSITKIIKKNVKKDIKSIDIKLHYVCDKCKSKSKKNTSV